MNPEEEIRLLKQRLGKLEIELKQFNFPDRYAFPKVVQFNKGITRAQIGTSPTDTIGFYGETPVSQQSAIAQPSGGATVDSQSRSAINSLITALQNIGIIA